MFKGVNLNAYFKFTYNNLTEINIPHFEESSQVSESTKERFDNTCKLQEVPFLQKSSFLQGPISSQNC